MISTAPDAHVATQRLLFRIGNEFALDFLSICRGGRDFADARIMSALMQSKSVRLPSGPEHQRQYAFFETPIPEPLRRSISVNSLATSLSLSFETVRRRTKHLIEEGLCVAAPDGIQISELALRSPEHRIALELTYTSVQALYGRVRRNEGLALMDLPPGAVPFPGPEAPLRIVWRAACDYFVRMGDVVLPAFPSLAQATVAMELFRANTKSISDTTVRSWTVNDDGSALFDQLQPARASHVAATLGLPYETTRRNLLHLVGTGRVRKIGDGYVVLRAPLFEDALKANLRNLTRMFAGLAQTGVLGRWDAEAARNPAAPHADCTSQSEPSISIGLSGQNMMERREYTFAFYRDGACSEFTRVFPFASDEEAIRQGNAMLQSQTQRADQGASSIRVGHGSEESKIKWLGSWDWDGGAARWVVEPE